MRTLIRLLRRFGSERGASMAEFVVVFAVMIILFLSAAEIAIAWFWWKSAEKAAQLGVRQAVVTDPAVAGLPERNARASGGLFGVRCRHASNPCVGFAALECTAGTTGACNAAAFGNLVTFMQGLFAPIQAQHVTVRYEYTGLGYAGGPTIPLVTLRLSGIPFQTGMVAILGNFLGGTTPLVTVPDMSVSLTGEDLSSAGAP